VGDDTCDVWREDDVVFARHEFPGIQDGKPFLDRLSDSSAYFLQKRWALESRVVPVGEFVPLPPTQNEEDVALAPDQGLLQVAGRGEVELADPNALVADPAARDERGRGDDFVSDSLHDREYGAGIGGHRVITRGREALEREGVLHERRKGMRR